MRCLGGFSLVRERAAFRAPGFGVLGRTLSTRPGLKAPQNLSQNWQGPSKPLQSKSCAERIRSSGTCGSRPQLLSTHTLRGARPQLPPSNISLQPASSPHFESIIYRKIKEPYFNLLYNLSLVNFPLLMNIEISSALIFLLICSTWSFCRVS